MALPAFRSKGAYGVGTNNCTAAMPTGTLVDDILLIVVESTDSTTAAGTPDTPSGYTKLFEQTQGAGATGVTTLTVFGKRHSGSESDVMVTGTANHVSATMLAFSGCVNTGTAWSVGSGTGHSTSTTGTCLSMTTPQADCLVLQVSSTTRDAISSNAYSAWANPNLTNVTEREDNTTNTAAGGGIGLADGGKAAAGSTGDSGFSVVVAPWVAVHIALLSPTGNTYNDSVTIARSDTLSDSMTLDMFPSESLSIVKGYTDTNTLDMNASVSLSKIDSVSDGGAMTMEVILGALQKVLGISTIGGADFDKAVSLARSAFLATSNDLTLDQSISIAKSLAITLTNDAALAAAVSLAKINGISTSVLTDFLISLTLANSRFINQSATVDIQASTIFTKSLFIITEGVKSGNIYEDSLSINKNLLVALLPDLVMSSAISLAKTNGINLSADSVLIASVSLNVVKAMTESVQTDLAALLNLSNVRGISSISLADLVASLPVSMQLGIGVSNLADFLAQVNLSKVNGIAFVGGKSYDATVLLNKLAGILTSSDVTIGVAVFPGVVIIIDTRITSVLALDTSVQKQRMSDAEKYIVTVWDE